MLSKETEYQITVKSDGQLEIKEMRFILEDGVKISHTNFRKVIDVGQDTANEDQMTKDLAQLIHTPKRIADRKAFKLTSQ